MNKDLFKQAIAEAKSVREAAITNAKAALEETLTPHLKSMLAAKLQEMEDKDDAVTEVEEAEKDKVKENSSDGGLTIVEVEDDSEEAELETGEEEELGDAPEGEESEEEENLENEDLGDLSVEQFREIVRDILAQELGNGEEAGLEGEEIPGEDAPDLESGEELDVALDAPPSDEAPDEDEIDLDELLRELEGMSAEAQGPGQSIMKEPSDAAAGGAENIINMVKQAIAKAPGIAKQISAVLADLGHDAASAINREGVEKELNEAVKTIKVLKASLQEVNVLNSKLLYVNKVFKAYNLSEAQKVNVIAAFDKAETVKEAKLVYETVCESTVITGQSRAKAAVSEVRKGRASKAVASTKKPVIAEVSEAVKRMQKLAGIITG